jgi:hypothetical protein
MVPVPPHSEPSSRVRCSVPSAESGMNVSPHVPQTASVIMSCSLSLGYGITVPPPMGLCK